MQWGLPGRARWRLVERVVGTRGPGDSYGDVILRVKGDAAPEYQFEFELGEIGSPIELYTRPRNKVVASFLGAPQMNMLAVSAVSGDGPTVDLAVEQGRARVEALVTRRPAALHSPLTLGVRPEHLRPRPQTFPRHRPPSPAAARPGSELSTQYTGRPTSVPVEADEGWQTVIEDMPRQVRGLPDAIAIL